jgi:hypothetical protein
VRTAQRHGELVEALLQNHVQVVHGLGNFMLQYPLEFVLLKKSKYAICSNQPTKLGSKQSIATIAQFFRQKMDVSKPTRLSACSAPGQQVSWLAPH